MDEVVGATGGKLGEYAFQGARDRPISDVLKDIFGNVEEIVRGEFKLAKVEIRDEAKKTAQAGAVMAAGMVLGIIAGVLFIVFVVQMLGLVMPEWAATLIVSVTLGAIAAILFFSGKKHLEAPMPDKAIQNIKEKVEWTKEQMKS